MHVDTEEIFFFLVLQALDLVNQTLLRAGDTVVIEDKLGCLYTL